jgi:predicted GIY-YIG superfamily endonuclease
MIKKRKDMFGYDIIYHQLRMMPMEGENVEDLKGDFEYLKKKLEACGIYIHFLNERKGICDVEVGIHEHQRSRGAGWFKKKTSKVSVGQVFEYQITHTTKETAAFAEISVKTLYNRKKALMEAGQWKSDNKKMF